MVVLQVNPDGVPMTIVDTSTADQATLERCVDEADAIVVVFAIDSAASLSSVEMRWLPLASKQCVPIIVLANKCDVVESSIDNLLEVRSLRCRCRSDTSAGDGADTPVAHMGINSAGNFVCAERQPRECDPPCVLPVPC